MTERDAKNVFLKSLYDFTKSNKSGEILLSNIAVENPGADLKQLSRICKGLKNAGWINAVMLTGGDGIITEVNSVALDYVEQNILPRIELNDDIARIKRLESDYYRLLNSQGDNANRRETIEAFHKWYSAAAILFSKHFDPTDSDFLTFKNADCSGNGYVLEHVYDSIRANVSVLISKLESVSSREQIIKVPKPKSMDYKELSKDIFIVHGHDEEMKSSVKALLLQLGLHPIILSEEPNGGKTIIEKFEDNSQKVDFAIVLMSDKDDQGCEIGKNDFKPRARQNVILELGYFIGKLGRRKHVCVLKKDGVEEPSDILGIAYTPYVLGQKSWKYEVADELQEAGFVIDKNKIR